MGFLSFEDARAAARRKLPKGLFDYIDRGVGNEASLRHLQASLDNTLISPRVLNGIQNPALETTLFGRTYAAPFVIAPTAMAGLVHRHGEPGLARAAAQFGIPFCLSTQSLNSADEIRAAAPDVDLWMQVYLWQDLQQSELMLRRAWDAGARVAVMTVDTPVGSRKEWNLRSGFNMPFRLCRRSITDITLRPGWLVTVVLSNLLRSGMPTMNNYPDGRRPKLVGPPVDPDLTLMTGLAWSHVDWLRDKWPGTLILKGILAAEDARRAVKSGADGIVVSSHGARNFDASPAPIDVLPQIAADAGDHLTVLADSGVRRGLDALRYQKNGAKAVMLGRLPLYALAAEGEPGVLKALEILKAEYAEALRFVAPFKT